MMNVAKLFAILSAVAVVSVAQPASAQTKTARQVGLDVAAQRGVPNPDCYARVFEKYARVVERANGTRSWNAQSTPAYNAELKSRCGVDRLAILRATPSAASGSSRGAYRAGLKLAGDRGYQGAQAQCFAGVYQAHAARTATPVGKTGNWYSAPVGPSYVGELWNKCQISA